MDGLIKGLVDVAIGHHRRNDDEEDNNNNNNSNNSEEIEERSRSSWAQVVSGEQDNDQTGQHTSYAAAATVDHTYQSQYVTHTTHENYQQNEAYERPSHNRNEENEQEENSDGWQTAHKKHHKRPQRVHMDHWNSYKSPPSEQQYSEEVNYAAEMEPSENELSDYISACAKLWELDFNRLNPGKDYELDVGEGKRVHEREDMAEASLFTWVDENVLRKPTFSRFCALLDNYNPYEGCKEKVSEEERREQAAFIEEISRTAPIKYLYKYLSKTGLFTDNYQEFKSMLKDLWFTLYGRGGTSGCSSSFEHVFVGEIKSRGEQQVSGFHNWLQFYLEEAKGKADYQGYILPRRNRQFPDAETQLLTVQFEWNGVLKSLSSMFIGVSPEFELALYTLCFFAGGEDNHIEVGPYPVNIKCYRLGNKIGSAFPIAEA
ncbi:poly(U)-specific endoribonuclease-B-like [Chenopodium quinoa]|nr:poly(U)-specific endoribonuclease-B-like [Chenopodium quinoa]